MANSVQGGESRSQKHTRIARRFVIAAELYLQEGDVVQASEKLWGATAHAIKVYCIGRGWPHSPAEGNAAVGRRDR